jgi:hypothetical protein
MKTFSIKDEQDQTTEESVRANNVPMAPREVSKFQKYASATFLPKSGVDVTD